VPVLWVAVVYGMTGSAVVQRHVEAVAAGCATPACEQTGRPRPGGKMGPRA
jgi:hypothetical protein